jgi:F-type H+-transporting ATPase subunit b
VNNPLVQPDPGLFIWTIVTFLVLLALLAKYAWRPLLDALDRREKMIARAIEDADRARADLERTHQESAKIVAAARVEAEAIIVAARSAAGHLGEELRRKAQAEAEAILRRAEREIQIETGRAIEQVRREAVDLSVDIASKLIRRRISKDDNLAIIQDAIAQIQTVKH